jgi:mono/diheme cytochrome c family protein
MLLSRIAKWVVAWAAGIATTGVVALLIIYSGAFDATATKPHEPIVAWATHTAFTNSVRLRARAVEAPDRFTRDQVVAGFVDYDQHCSACHGAPGIGRAAFAAGMVPTPPYLLEASHQWTPAELYWIVHEGVKMTGMPAWGESQSDSRVWKVVAFLEALPALSAGDYARLREGQALPPTGDRAAALAAEGRIPAVISLREIARFPPWLDLISEISLLCAGLCAVIILQDVVRRPQQMWIMNVVWPVTALFGGVLWLAGYYLWGRSSPDGTERSVKPPFPVQVAVGASHCGAGCTLGDIGAEWLAFALPAIAVAFGWHTLFAEKSFAVWILDYILAFVIGIGFQYFTIKPIRDLSVGDGLRQAVKADIASISAWQVGMYGLMAILQFAILRPLFGQIAPVDSPEFWFAMQLAMLAGFCTSYPVNWWLIRIGVKEVM